MKADSVSAACEGQGGDPAEFVHGADAEGVSDIVSMIDDGHCFVLHGEDALLTSLEEACREGRSCMADVSISQTEGNAEGAKCNLGHKYKLVIVMNKKEGGAPGARLARRTRAQIGQADAEQAGPERRQGILNLGLGVAIFAMMSVTSLAILAPPYSYPMAAGALVPAGIMLARAARKHA